MKQVILDAATVVGCCVGVGFLCGKEAQLYFGNVGNVVIFAIVFALLNLLVRRFCAQNRCFNVADLARTCFGKGAPLFNVLFLLCCFVCVVTMLAGVESCLARYCNLQLPLFALIVCAGAAAVLKGGMRALKVLNAFSVLLTLIFLVSVAALGHNGFAPQQVSALQPIKYALFSVTMSLGVLAPLSVGKNGVATAIATAVLCALVVFVLWIADFSLAAPIFGKTGNTFVDILGGVTVVAATVTGVAANTLPIWQGVRDVFQDDTLCYTVIFTLAVAFSMFGFDFALNYGYLFVALTGIILAAALIAKRCKKPRRTAATQRNCRSTLRNGNTTQNSDRAPQQKTAT